MGKLIRYLIIATISLVGLIITRLSFMDGATNAFQNYFSFPHYKDGLLVAVPLYTCATFGAGWGSFITFSSMNNFTTNILRTSWIICFGQMLIINTMSLVSLLLEYIIEGKYNINALSIRTLYTIYKKSYVPAF